MAVIFSQQFILFSFVAIGYLLSKTGVVKESQSKLLSSLIVYVFAPCNVLKTFSSRFTVEYLTENYQLLLTSTVILLVLFVAAHFLAKLFTKNKYERTVYEYSLVISNYGYIGYALAESLLGTAGLMNFMTFTLPAALYIYTIGFSKLTKSGLNLKKLCNPPMIATVVGMAAGLLNIPIPDVLTSIMSSGSACLAPVSMLLTGIVISGFPLKRIIKKQGIYPLTAIRLILLPLLGGCLLSPFCDKATVQSAVLFLALPCGMNTVVFPKLVDEDCELGAGIALVSTVLACVTLPLVLSPFL